MYVGTLRRYVSGGCLDVMIIYNVHAAVVHEWCGVSSNVTVREGFPRLGGEGEEKHHVHHFSTVLSDPSWELERWDFVCGR